LGLPDDPWWLAVAILGLVGLALFAYTVRALDAAGSVASFLLGLEVTLVGGLGWMLLLVCFTALGFVVTLVGHGRKKARRLAEGEEGERGLPNVLGNGAAAGLVALAMLAPVPEAAVAAAFTAAVAAVAADTAASEIGMLAGRARSILPPFRPVPVGDDGGVSLRGQAAAATAATLIALAAMPLAGLTWRLAAVAGVAGFLGCQVDSVLGATVERGPRRAGFLGKQQVNFLASLAPALVVLVVVGAMRA
jgi:uncharacterized protein (TIGR00297 family)